MYTASEINCGGSMSQRNMSISTSLGMVMITGLEENNAVNITVMAINAGGSNSSRSFTMNTLTASKK